MNKATKIIALSAVLLLVVLALSFPLANWAGATTLTSDVWVAPPPRGNDSNPGTEAQPFATIQMGVDNVASEGTVHVAAGVYHENVHINGAANLEGAGAPITIIDGGGTGTTLTISSLPNEFNQISGLTIQGGSGRTELWNPASEDVLFAGINLHFIQDLPRLFTFGGSSEGGGIYIYETHIVFLNDCTIKDNQASRGGGIYNEGFLLMNGCTVSGNTASQAGGGIYNASGGPFGGGVLVMANCTVSGNEILSNQDGTVGVGIANAAGSSASLAYCTVANNTTTDPDCRGGGFYNAGDINFVNTIVANNRAGTGNNGYTDGAATTLSFGHNLDSENSCGFDQPTDLINTNPLLGPLEDNGGPTFTHALMHGSPAIDHGVCGAIINQRTQNLIDEALNGLSVDIANQLEPKITDQRGVPRPQGPACDIGAYELAQAAVGSATGKGTVSFSTINGYISNLTAFDESGVSCPPRSDLEFPFGLFSFNVTDITPGSTATIVLILPSDAPTSTEYWKCIGNRWVDCTSLLGSNDGDRVLTLTITDGGLGDRDGSRNGSISDPGGPVKVVKVQTLFPPQRPRASATIPHQVNQAAMSVQYLSVNPQQIAASQPVTILTNVANTGDQAGNYPISLKINGQVEETRMVSVGPRTAQPVKFTVTKAEPGTYTVDIAGQKSSFTVTDGKSTSSTSSNGAVIALLILGAMVIITVVALLVARRRPA